MRILFAGSPEVAVPTLERLLASEHEVVGVLSQPDAQVGRGRKVRPSAVAERALAAGLPVLRPERSRDALDDVRALAPDLAVVVAYGQLIGRDLLAVPRHGWVNLHFSVLPRWRGAAPVQRAIMAGDAETGSTVFRLVPQLDAGPVYAVSRTAIGPDESAGELLARLAVDGGDLVLDAVARIEAGDEPHPQDADGVTLAPKLLPEDGRLDWSRPAAELDRQVRGCTPQPGAWTTLRGERLKVVAASPAAGDGAPGVLAVTKNDVRVGTGEGQLRLLQVQPAGKRAMPAADWARGVAGLDGERVGA